MGALGIVLRIGAAGLFLLSVVNAIRPRPLEVALLLSFAVLLHFTADMIADRRRVK